MGDSPRSLIIIPARYGSSRLPGKPLVKIAGKSMIQRVWEIAKAVTLAERVLVATDDQRIFEACTQFSAEVVMTPPACENGTERALAALEKLDLAPEIVINFQGDAVTTPSAMVSELLEFMLANSAVQMATIAKQLDPQTVDTIVNSKEQAGSMTFVTFARDGRALYFSRSQIPNFRDKKKISSALYKHVGIYAYRLPTLRQYVALPPSALEQAEKLEQLRALENGIPIHVVVTQQQCTLVSVDNPEDVARAEAVILAQGSR